MQYAIMHEGAHPCEKVDESFFFSIVGIMVSIGIVRKEVFESWTAEPKRADECPLQKQEISCLKVSIR